MNKIEILETAVVNGDATEVSNALAALSITDGAMLSCQTMAAAYSIIGKPLVASMPEDVKSNFHFVPMVDTNDDGKVDEIDTDGDGVADSDDSDPEDSEVQ